MSNLNILEPNGVGSRYNVNGMSEPIRPLAGTVQNVAFTGTEGTATAVQATTSNVRLTVDANARILLNATVIATTGTRLLADTPEWFELTPGDVIHVIAE